MPIHKPKSFLAPGEVFSLRNGPHGLNAHTASKNDKALSHIWAGSAHAVADAAHALLVSAVAFAGAALLVSVVSTVTLVPTAAFVSVAVEFETTSEGAASTGLEAF